MAQVEGTIAPAVAQAAVTAEGASEQQPARRRPRIGGQFGAYTAVLIVSFISLFPFYWMIVNSFRDNASVTTTVALWPSTWHFDNYSAAWNGLPSPFQIYLVNSFMMTLLVVIGTVISCAIVAYGFARFRFPGRELLFAFVISTMMIPYAVTLIPQYAEFINIFHWGGGGQIFGYTNFYQFLPQIVPAFFGSPVWIFLLRQFIRGIPYDLDEAAKIDGAGPLRILWKIIIPEIRPALAAITVLTFIGKWNDLLGPLIYLQDPKNWTVEIALLGFFSRYSSGGAWAYFMDLSFITMIPIIVLYFFASKQIIQGVTLSGVKG
jgi:multiple sugar transport system permease protein